MIPVWMNLRVTGAGGRSVRIPLPFLLIWLPVVALLILILPLVLLGALAAWLRGYGPLVLLGYWRLLVALSSLSGLRIAVVEQDRGFRLDII